MGVPQTASEVSLFDIVNRGSMAPRGLASRAGAAIQRACAIGAGCRADGAGSANAGITSAANSRRDFCASRTSSVPKLICSEACSNLPIAARGAGDDGFDLVGRADPGAARFDLAVEGERAQPAHRLVVVAIVLGGGAARPVADRLVERAEIFLERPARDLARKPRILVTEHVEGDHHLAVAGVAGVAPGLAVELDERPRIGPIGIAISE